MTERNGAAVREQTGGLVALGGVSPSQIFEMAELDRLCFEEETCYPPWTFYFILTSPGSDGFSLHREDGFLVGFILFRKESRSAGSIVTIDVHPKERRKGWGTRLLREGEGALAAAGVREVRLQVAVENRGAISFYEGNGYRIRRTLKGYYGPGKSAYLMLKRISEKGSPSP
jgi:ribosomal-protein-alanine N-acetyltransferase